VTAPVLLAALRRRGIEVIANNGTIRARPRARLTDVDRAALRQHKAAVLAALRAEASRATTAADDRWADGVPDAPCGLCGSPLAWVEDWPTPGEARWLCPRCAGQSVPSLEAVYASLSVDEGRRLLDEARAGDPLARLLLTLVPVSGAA
jgi:hypothetical protein